ncbi:hypothetical protein [Sulfurimonas sp.]|uniref:hypothetical protein n=1 Tax=Sulfurimonas sp. TaxID=2022749 RepID=UPI0025E5127D|nr:hypothetical protein [Sulfurimonas sp.]MDD5156734.1 hypothetical protein [Sulfurimonas sp.]
MQPDFIEFIKPTPKLQTRKCKVIAFLIGIFLRFSSPFISLVAWYLYDYFIALLALALSFIAVGIIGSYLRNSSLPANNREYRYSDAEIAIWYTNNICFKENYKEEE